MSSLWRWPWGTKRRPFTFADSVVSALRLGPECRGYEMSYRWILRKLRRWILPALPLPLILIGGLLMGMGAGL